MNDNFKMAVAFAKNELQGLYDRGGSFYALKQKARSEILDVFSDDFEWHTNLNKADHDFHSFDSLKRYCAHLIRSKKRIPDELRHWISDVLEDALLAPKRPRGALMSGIENNFLLPRLVEKVAVKFNLPRMREESSDKLSACDAVHQAIIQIPEATDIKSRQYSTIRQAYSAAKKRGIFIDN